MTLLHFDTNHRNKNTIVYMDLLAGKDIVDPSDDLQMLESLLIFIFKAHQLNTRLATDSASSIKESIIGDAHRIKDGFLINLGLEIVLGRQVNITHLKTSTAPFSIQ
ncbi:MAG: hypothetical protein IM631_13285 [Cytophagales bacterium]|jgi:hypothetical protein|nr:hypothetical protein [Cytophagales bacterium]MCA6372347.1 hypothetical protein [Cytophagales bacterium]MCA6382493.1 hypothetical protein [Cytophagales bacterium]